MNRMLALVTAAGVCVLTLTFWYLVRDDDVPRASERSKPEPEKAVDEPVTRRSADVAASMQRWMDGGYTPSAYYPAPSSQDLEHPDLPKEVSEIFALCVGRSLVAANNPQVKEKIRDLVDAEHDQEELEAMAEFFRKSDDPAFKYQMMIAFRYFGAAPMIEPVKEYYDVEPIGAMECLQWMASRDPAVLDTFSELLENEVIPSRREALVQRAALSTGPAAEKFLCKVLDRGEGTPEEKFALQALGRLGTDESRRRIDAILDGDRRSAVYDPAGDAPESPLLEDVRAHAVAGVLAGGREDDVRRLFDRYRRDSSGDAVAGYVEEFLSIAPTRALVPDVVALAVSRGVLSNNLLQYLETRAETGDEAELGKLLQISSLDSAARERVQNLIVKVR